jgi:acyl carrier protein
MSDVRARVRNIILDEYLPGEDPAELQDDTPIITGGILDSVSTLRFVTQLEKEFGIALDARDAEYENLDTVNAIASLVEGKLAQNRR